MEIFDSYVSLPEGTVVDSWTERIIHLVKIYNLYNFLKYQLIGSSKDRSW